jgi:hypothetical protein
VWLREELLMTRYRVSVLIPETDAAHAYATNPRLTIDAEAPDEVYDFVARRYPTGVVMRLDVTP